MDDEDTIELTITKGFFKKSANYFVGVRMLGHAGKVKTELIEDITKAVLWFRAYNALTAVLVGTWLTTS